MSTFALRKVEVVKAKQELDELVIDGVGQLAAFEELLATKHKQYISELRTMLTYVEHAANGNTLPDTRFKDVTPTGVLIKEYEFKSKHLRLYAIKQLNGKVIVLGGLKTTQKSDFKRFRSLKEQYLNSL
ncbi:hypothetical protein [Spirosoma pollinicola]|uniref:Addiction module toxin RelE n=1 Tax=Spirosoma pollinicola TaxID=2057025 RepID=A0A2K8YUV6_9BACT|nr:hypothetical protein [Spirosoma pollinicola]AUD01364.1 hypothetical protein CWM47_05790 [Spirosoma pollinicola]